VRGAIEAQREVQDHGRSQRVARVWCGIS
jgi:hypothetical protein